MVKLTEGTLTPAYGRDYKSIKMVEKDFRAGKDFYFNSFAGGAYCSIRDCEKGDKIKFRYNKQTKVCFITV